MPRQAGICVRWSCAYLALTLGSVALAAPLPVEQIFRRPAYTDVKLAPDGSKMAAIVPLLGRRNLAVIDLGARKAVAVTGFRGNDVSSYQWISDNRLIVDQANLSDASGDIRLLGRGAIDADGRNPLGLPFGWGASVVATLDSDDIIMRRYVESYASAGAYLVNTRTGHEQLLTWDNPGDVVQWVADHHGNVRVALSVVPRSNRTSIYARPRGEGPWHEIASYATDASQRIVPLAFDFDDRMLYVWSNRGRDKGGIFRFDPEKGELLDLVFASDAIDVLGLLFDYQRKVLAGFVDPAARDSVTWVDPRWRGLQEAIDAALPESRNWLSWGRDNSDRIIVTAISDKHPAKFYLFDVKTRRMEELFSSGEWLANVPMASMTEVHYAARDGLSIPAWLMLPVGSSGKNLPMVVIIHGGPHAGTVNWGFNPEAQFFASRGYAVLMPNFRGSPGFGRAFLEAGYKQWGLAMQDDITDGVRWAVHEGIADPHRVCLYGGSYGGYAALMGTIKEPGMFRCAIAFVAVTDLERLTDPSWTPMVRGDIAEREVARTIGDPASEMARLRELSPVNLADKVSAPLLLAYGDDDPRVPLIQGTSFRRALDAAHKTYEWVDYPHEAHGFNKDENRFDFYRRVDRFLASYLSPGG